MYRELSIYCRRPRKLKMCWVLQFDVKKKKCIKEYLEQLQVIEEAFYQ